MLALRWLRRGTGLISSLGVIRVLEIILALALTRDVDIAGGCSFGCIVKMTLFFLVIE